MTGAVASIERVPESGDLEVALPSMRLAQRRWAEAAVEMRTEIIRKFRYALAADAKGMASAVRDLRVHSSVAEVLSSEVLPLLDACQFAEKHAAELLRSVKLKGKGRPFWLAGTDLELRREPLGVVLIIAPGNYPLFLSGVQAIQALIAGNAVLLKPAPGATPVAHRFRDFLVEAGLSEPLFHVLEEYPEAAQRAIERGVDKIILTGSESTGRDVLRRASESITPVTCELSGCDAVVILPRADLDLAASAIRFGLRLNASQTCMRPHRIFVHSDIAVDFTRRLVETTRNLRIPLTSSATARLIELLQSARERGVAQIAGEIFDDCSATPHIFQNGDSAGEIWHSDIFAPVLLLRSFDSERALVENFETCRYGLGASIFGPTDEGQRLSARLNTGFVIINDVIVPTADPRFPFSGRKRSGFGVTRGAEGLLEFTKIKAVSIRRSGYRHLQSEHAVDEHLFAGTIAAMHGRDLLTKIRGAMTAFAAARRRMKATDKVSS